MQCNGEAAVALGVRSEAMDDNSVAIGTGAQVHTSPWSRERERERREKEREREMLHSGNIWHADMLTHLFIHLHTRTTHALLTLPTCTQTFCYNHQLSTSIIKTRATTPTPWPSVLKQRQCKGRPLPLANGPRYLPFLQEREREREKLCLEVSLNLHWSLSLFFFSSF